MIGPPLTKLTLSHLFHSGLLGSLRTQGSALNIAYNLAPGSVGDAVVAAGLGNFAINLFGRASAPGAHTVSSLGTLDIAVNLAGRDNTVKSGAGLFNRTFNFFGSNNSAIGEVGVGNAARNFFGDGNTVTAAGGNGNGVTNIFGGGNQVTVNNSAGTAASNLFGNGNRVTVNGGFTNVATSLGGNTNTVGSSGGGRLDGDRNCSDRGTPSRRSAVWPTRVPVSSGTATR